jgi:hypothetical protein
VLFEVVVEEVSTNTHLEKSHSLPDNLSRRFRAQRTPSTIPLRWLVGHYPRTL